MSAVYYLLAIAAGLGITLQTTLNGQLAKGVGGDSVAAALFSFTAGAVCLGLFSLMRGGIVTSQAIDHFGLMGAVERPVSFVKLGGSVVMLAGLAIALFGDRWSALGSNWIDFCKGPRGIVLEPSQHVLWGPGQSAT